MQNFVVSSAVGRILDDTPPWARSKQTPSRRKVWKMDRACLDPGPAHGRHRKCTFIK